MSTPQEFQRVSAELTQLRAQVAALADLWAGSDEDREFILGEYYADDLRALLEES